MMLVAFQFAFDPLKKGMIHPDSPPRATALGTVPGLREGEL